jgi:hypothetical protein
MIRTAEEVEDASLVVLRVMWWSYVINIIIGVLMLITMLFEIGSLDATLDSTAPYLNRLPTPDPQEWHYSFL